MLWCAGSEFLSGASRVKLDPHKIDQVFQSAIDVSPDRRAMFLDNACAEDAELLAEVESLLNADQAAGSFIQGSAADVAAALLGNRKTPPTQVGQYKIERMLGAGGMGEVYLAQDRMGR